MKGLAPLFLGIFGTFAFSWVGLTVIPNWATSFDQVFAQDAVAPLIVFDTPKFSIGILTDVETIFITRP